MKHRKRQLAGIGICTVLLMLASVYVEKKNIVLNEDNNLVRGEPGTGNQDIEMEVEIPELDQTFSYHVKVDEREYTMDEREQLFDEAKKEIDKIFPSNGETADHITRQVNLSETLVKGQVLVEWSFGDSLIIGTDGTIQSEYVVDDGTLVHVQARLSIGEYECIYQFPCYVYPEEITGKDSLLRRLAYVLSENSKRNESDDEMSLPQTIGKYTLKWRQKQSYTLLWILILGVSSIAVTVLMDYEQARRREEERKRKLRLEYPQMVAKMALLLGAGMSVKQAWERLCDAYIGQLSHGNCQKSELYEQMKITYRQMRDGLGEIQAYEQFGERSGLSLYRRFAMLLIQNLQKGNAGLSAAIESEADRAFEERKNNARRLGEEAGTKLLGPMMIMMAVVILILMVPAVLTMKI